ncbi:MAG: hypothetical protein BroJett018_25900 [Chloroflexota bacterium]|nr:MAG: hypothetical protein BroJett018_25900 [Chloroflexota bacterium]
MKRLKFAWLLVVAALLTPALNIRPAAAQDDWFAYVFNSAKQEFIKVNADGSHEIVPLGVPEGVYANGDDMAFSYNGAVVVFCYLQNTDTGSIAHLVVRDLSTQTTAIDVELGEYIGCRVGKNGLGMGGMMAYVGLANDPSNGRPAWELRAIEPFGGTTMFTLDASMPEAAVIEPYGGPMLPYIYGNDSQAVTFGVIPYGIGGPINVQAYAWPLVGELTPVANLGNFGVDVLPYTGEMVWPEADETLPAGNPGGPMIAGNVVRYADRDGNVSTIFHSPDWVIYDVAWVNGGQQIAMLMFSSFDETNPTPQTVRYVLLGRDGSQVEFNPAVGYLNVTDTANGYLEFSANYPQAEGQTYNVQLVRIANGAAIMTWTYEAPDSIGALSLVWAPPSEFANNFEAFPAIQ